MRALIHEGLVVDMADAEFPVHESMVWVDADESVGVGHSYLEGVFTAPAPEPERPEPAVSQVEMMEALWDKAKGNNTKFDAAELKRNN